MAVTAASNGEIKDLSEKKDDSNSSAGQMDMFSDTWGFNLEDLYKISLIFFKEKLGSKALEVGYKDKLRMVALTKQVAHGPCNDNSMPPVGLFDVVGNDRRLAWQSLGNMSREDAMNEFVLYLRKHCPLFAPYVQAQFAEKEEQDRKRREQEEEAKRSREELERLHTDAAALQEEEKKRQLAQEMMIRAALNQQTAVQFQQYAEQQFPGNPAQQEALVHQLQDQHYIQYMQQFYSQQIQQQQQATHPQQQHLPSPSQQPAATQSSQLASSSTSTPSDHPPQQPKAATITTNGGQTATGDSSRVIMATATSQSPTHQILPNGLQKPTGSEVATQSDDDPDGDELPPIAAASMWTRKDMKEFKDSVKNDPESLIKVGSGEIVTVRVPTHEDGSCLFWEFATDSYDIGFGVYFEWTVDTSNQMSIITESSDEDDEEHGRTGNADPNATEGKAEPEVPTEEIVPPFRRDCHQEVYCGSHVYPGRGVYLLKFDNSYSLWRGKTLYYRVFYTR